MSVCAKSPMAYPERYCYGNMGGFFGAELKKAGWDGIVIDGRAPSPVYLLIDNDKVEIRDASWLWGKSCYQVEEMLLKEHGDRVRFVTTGVAGENLVRSAVLFGSHQASVTAGFGAVMASKNLKAIVVRGTGPNPAVADPAGLKELNRYTLSIKKTISLMVGPRFTATNHGHLLEDDRPQALLPVRPGLQQVHLPHRQGPGPRRPAWLPVHGILPALDVRTRGRAVPHGLRRAHPGQRLLHRHLRAGDT